MPNPWLALGTLFAMLTCLVIGDVQGHKAERKTCELAAARQRAVAGEMLAESEGARIAAERAFNQFKDQVELDNATQEAQIADAHAAYRKLLIGAGGLRDPNGTTGGACRGDKLSPNSGAASNDSASATGCRLSRETSEALLDLARDADRAAAYAQSCRQWAVGLGVHQAD